MSPGQTEVDCALKILRVNIMLCDEKYWHKQSIVDSDANKPVALNILAPKH